MKLNNDCLRDILLTVESIRYGSVLTLDGLHNRLPDYSRNELEYHCLKLHEANYLTIRMVKQGLNYEVAHIKDLTYQGHEFLNNIHSDDIWNHVKSIGQKVGASSISATTQIAATVVSTIIKNQLGI